MISDITVLILTYNEAPNLQRTLERLTWASRVVILDSHSTDSTRDIARSFANVHWMERAFDDHTSQWNHGLDAVSTPWVLALDADYVLEAGFAKELVSLKPGDVAAYYAGFRYLIFGQPLRKSLYPPRAVLFRKDRCRYIEDGHTQLLEVKGESRHLTSKIDHDDRKPLSRWFGSQLKYAELEAAHLLKADRATLSLQDKVRLSLFAGPPLVLLHTLLVQGLILDGWRGWYYAWQRVLAEVLLALHLLEGKLQSAARKSDP
jgi:glycosyltransferase involved in cell wall biosynthesis